MIYPNKYKCLKNKKMQLESFLSDLSDLEIRSDADFLQKAENNLSNFKRKILSVVYAKNKSEVQKIVEYANKYLIPLYPISQGKNWGLGSKLPFAEEAVIVDLSKMNKIIALDNNFGYVTLEPGVTQEQLKDFLDKNSEDFIIDVTGAPAETSIIGNIMERGVAYNSLRFEKVMNLSIITGTGEVLKTGFSHYENSKVANLFKYGIGPDLTGLFIQSNFGIVLSATIELMPKPQYESSFLLSIDDEAKVGEVFEILKKLRRQRVFESIVHIGNTHRSLITLAPMVYRYFKSIGKPKTREESIKFLKSYLSGEWSAVGALMGTKAMVKKAEKEIKKALKNYGKITFINEAKVNLARNLSKILGMKNLYAYLKSLEPLLGLTHGIPTSEALHSLYWPMADENPNWKDPDNSPFGLMFAVPVIPMDKESVNGIINIFNNIEQKYKVKIAATLNTMNNFTLEGVVSFDFDLKSEQSTQNAKKGIRELNQQFIDFGLTPYRINIDNTDLLIDQKDIFWQKVKELKQVFDPNNIISPRKYNLI